MRLLLVTAILLLSNAVLAESRVQETMLDNGMKIIVKEDHRAPIMVSQVWYKVGASYEPDGITGISHALEHMMFKGTALHPPGQFSRIIAQNGGTENAFTGRDYTAYFQTMSSDRLEIALELEADRMRHLTLPADEFAKEIEVVKEERRLRTEDKPTGQVYEQFSALAYRSLPYANPVIGWMNDLENMKIEDLADWYRLWYAPNNATLVVVGDVKPEAVFSLAKQYFGPLKREAIPKLKPLREPQQKGETRSVVKVPANEPYMIMGFKTPAVTTAEKRWEPYALEMLVAVLDGGNSARFSKHLVRGSEIAVSAGAEYNAFTRLPGMLLIDGTPAQGRTMQELESALRQEIVRLRSELVTEEELDRVRTQVIASKVFELDSVFYQAMEIGMLETVGLDWRLIDQYVAALKQVTPEQVREVAERYLVDDNLTITQLEPLPMDNVKPVRRATGGRHGG
ncbi:M16 family metallopeptidase [Sedimenticola selenatireducens]|uniref:Insulinase family protein n=1 Tax=Sedimenticola selenatireducens TaxID=191960 RepID=A0A557S0N9_9GAMM|nr:pitrilysin family protein [Sedimenticola selenatireducens]TVO70983.1 insulinase family protein [Sedimenticola selenatireducens]TVT65849.1 MAG: insulinase family protein [Sedimenticola selenatireducens]